MPIGRLVKEGEAPPSAFTISKNNVRKSPINKEALELLSMSIAEDGVTNRVIVNPKMEIIAGQRRYLSCIETKRNVPYVMYDFEGLEYDSWICEMCTSFQENHQHRDVESVDKGKAVIELHEVGKLQFDKIAKLMGASLPSVYNWYNEAKGPQALRNSVIEEHKKEEVLKEEKKKEKKEKEKKAQPTLDETPVLDEKLMILEKLRLKCKKLWDQLPQGLRYRALVIRIIDSDWCKHINGIPNYEKIEKVLLYCINGAKSRDLESMAKDIGRNIPVDLEFRMEVLQNIENYELRQFRLPKTLFKYSKPIQKRRGNMDSNQMVAEAIRDWIEKWTIEEKWETEVTSKTPECFEKK